MRRAKPFLITLAAGLIILTGCGELGVFGHHRPDHAGGGDDACPPGHERRGLCTPDFEPEPEPFKPDRYEILPKDMVTKVGETVTFRLVFWTAGKPHQCVLIDGVAGLLEIRQDGEEWYVADDPGWHPWGCDATQVKAKDPSIATVYWAPLLFESWSALASKSGALRAGGLKAT